MKTKGLLLMLLTVLVSMTSIVNSQNKKETTKCNVIFNVEMDCHSCQQKIEKNISFEKGVKAMKVDLPKQTVELTYDSRKTDIAKLTLAFEKLGYPATVKEPKAPKQ